MNKVRYIRDFETIGIKAPKERGGGFLPTNCHLTALCNVIDNLKKDANMYAKNKQQEFTHQWLVGMYIEKLKFTEVDIFAFNHWENISRIYPVELFNCDDFGVNYLNIARIGSFGKKIVTADLTPYITFQNWVREGYEICTTDSLHIYDKNAKKFIKISPNLHQKKADDEVREGLQEELGKEV